MATVPTILGPLYVDDRGNADEPVALLWPSLFTDHRMWHHQIEALRDNGWRTLALDPPGHGQSPGPGRAFTMDECAEAALAVLDATGVRTPVVVIGDSWGGFVAPRIALRAPDRVRGMLLFGTSAERGAPLARTSAKLLTNLFPIGALRKMLIGTIVSSLLATETRSREPEIASNLAEHLGEWNPRGVVTAVRSVLVDRDSVLDALPSVKSPTLVVSGKEDTIFPYAHGQRIAYKLANARHVEIPNAAHLVPLEAPKAANQLILEFVRQLPHS